MIRICCYCVVLFFFGYTAQYEESYFSKQWWKLHPMQWIFNYWTTIIPITFLPTGTLCQWIIENGIPENETDWQPTKIFLIFFFFFFF